MMRVDFAERLRETNVTDRLDKNVPSTMVY